MKCIKSPYFRAFMHFLFSHIGLCFLVTIYCVLGALLFMFFEADLERHAVNSSRTERCTAEGKRDELIQRVLVAYNNSELHRDDIKEWLDDFHFNTMFAENTRSAYRRSTDSCDTEPKHKWTLASAVLFTVTTVAAIGYGNIYPTTDLSRFVLICYSLIGIPLTLMFLTNIGRLFAWAVRVMFSHGVCYFCWKRRNRNQEEKTKLIMGTNVEEHRATTMVESINENEKLEENSAAARKKREEEEYEKEEKDRLQMVVPKSFIFSILGVYAFVGTLFFSWSEGWTYIEGAYFNVVTLMTIGLGDLVPGWSSYDTVVGKVKMGAGAIYIMLGLGVVFMGLNVIVDELMNASKRAGKKMGLVKEEKVKIARSNLERAVRRQVY